jgi:hypothetical protein
MHMQDKILEQHSCIIRRFLSWKYFALMKINKRTLNFYNIADEHPHVMGDLLGLDFRRV